MTADDDYFSQRRAEIEHALEAWLPSPPEWPAPVSTAMRYSLLAGGKRMRPILALASAEAVATLRGESIEAARRLAMPAACALEMIHTYSLIHDDLPAMDDDTLRRGRPTLHVVVGDGMAILAGDGLQAAAFQLLASEPRSDDPVVAARKLRTIALIAEAAGPAGMVGGQAIDLMAVRPGPGEPPTPLGIDELQAMHARKTGALIRASCAAGAVLAGADESLLGAIDRYAGEIGLAFQIVDDILDVEGESAGLGKTAGKDAAAGKPTYPALYGLEPSRALATACLARAQAQLAAIGLEHSHLSDIARRIVTRRT